MARKWGMPLIISIGQHSFSEIQRLPVSGSQGAAQATEARVYQSLRVKTPVCIVSRNGHPSGFKTKFGSGYDLPYYIVGCLLGVDRRLNLCHKSG